MHRNKIYQLVFIGLLILAVECPTAVAGPPQEGGVLPDFYLLVPQEERYRQYLGLDEKNEFKISDIKAEVVIVQIFSIY